MNIVATFLLLQMSLVCETSTELTRDQAEAAMARITDVYQKASELRFVLDIAQEPTGRYIIHTVQRPYAVWYRVEDHGEVIYEVWTWDMDAFLSPPLSIGAWMVVDINYTVGGLLSAFKVETEQFYRGWGSENDTNIIVCFTHIINRPIVGTRSNLVRLIDKLLGTRADLLPSREYMDPATYIPCLSNGDYIGPDFPTDKILHIWRRPAGPAFMGNEGTDLVTLCMKDNEWIVLRRMTAGEKDLTVKDTWKVDSKSGSIVQWDRDFGHNMHGLGQIRTRKFTYQEH